MKLVWKKLLFQTIFWLLGELFLSFLGIDVLADYSEFTFAKRLLVQPVLVNYDK